MKTLKDQIIYNQAWDQVIDQVRDQVYLQFLIINEQKARRA